jgi:sulfur-oxidizing protein SoxA
LPRGCLALSLGLVLSISAGAAQSGLAYLGAELKALQADPFANPGLLWVDRGTALWRASPAPGVPSCASCHGSPESLREVVPALPRWNPATQRLENLEGLIRQCQSERQHQPPAPFESPALLALATRLAHGARGLPLSEAVAPDAAPALARGEAFFRERRGQLGLSCADCHERYKGARLRGDRVSEGMINGFPIYRLTWQTLGSRHRMFQWCNEAVRATPYPFGAEPYLELELFLRHRGAGLPVETPAVRR